MQDKSNRRSNRDRTESTCAALVAAARHLFVDKGYAETGTPEIAAAAGVTRGALYHHFADKAALFRAVVVQEAAAVAARIAGDSRDAGSPVEALFAGAEAYFAAMAAPGRARLLLLEGPAVLGRAAMDEIDRRTGGTELRDGLADAMAGGTSATLPLDALTAVLSAAFDRAALDIAAGEPAEDYQAVLRALLSGLMRDQGS